tara:strand:- start:313 stop:579 length:267 start_codon:yes stop_codon:yes gene_type:complete
MKKELKYFLYIITIFGFLIFVGNYYFSDQNIKNFYKSIKLHDNKIIKYSNNLLLLKNDTNNIIEYVENNIKQDKKKYKFWDLLYNDKE